MEKRNKSVLSEHWIKTTKTARYFQLGEYTKNTKYLWFVFHGYGQLARPFLEQFQDVNDEHLFIAPEGLSKFYWRGFGGAPVASWMTKESRQEEIEDYIQFLNRVYFDVIIDLRIAPDLPIIGLGFSQGTATLSRWMCRNHFAFSNIVLWAGPLAHDIYWKHEHSTFDLPENNFLVCGNEDQFIAAEDIEQQKKYLRSISAAFKYLEFNGGHKIDTEILQSIVNLIEQQ